MNRKKVVVIGSVILALVLLVALFIYGNDKKEKLLEKKEAEQSAREEETVDYDGESYEYNYRLRNILFIGVDKAEEFQEWENGWAGQADCLILLSADKEKKETRLLQISRDTMTGVEVYGQDEVHLGTERMQIAAQYAYGDGEKSSCQMTVKAVSNLLYEIPIHSYVALNVEGIAKITDLMGGVKMTIPEDYTYIDPAFKEGETLVLNGQQAEKYVRYRDTSVTGSNSQRMERQTQFLSALAVQLQGKDAGWYQRLWDGAGEHIVSDITAKEMEYLSQYPMEEEIVQVPGEVKEGTEHDEFVVDSKKLKEIVIKLFYKTEN